MSIVDTTTAQGKPVFGMFALMAEIAASCGVTPMTVYRNIQTAPHHADQEVITPH